MAKRRMFSLDIVDTDAFMDMSLTTQSLYFHLGMRADDDGFVSNPKKIMRMLGTQEDDYKVLVVKKFIIPFDTGVCVIKHWKMNNYIQSDRKTATNWKKEFDMLEIDEKTRKYRLSQPKLTDCIQTGYKLDTQLRLGKGRLGNTAGAEAPASPKIIIGNEEHNIKDL